MAKTILLTGATDGIGLETARKLAVDGHRLLLHGRNPAKLEAARIEISALAGGGTVETFLADLSRMSDVAAFADAVTARDSGLDVLINNAGVFATPHTRTADGLDVRFAVNTFAPYLLTLRLRPRLGAAGRVVNLSSAAQAPVDLAALAGEGQLSDNPAYAQSKLALTMWNRALAAAWPDGPVMIAVNPGSLLGSKMVKEAYGVAGGDLGIGAGILCRAALDASFAEAGGLYFDNDAGRFADPHPDALDDGRVAEVVKTIDGVLARILG
ncbi:oxidoreductase [Acidobacteria bacterium Mor1]|nr:oxidoreductase [Acidobacteria bacterium Mor1]